MGESIIKWTQQAKDCYERNCRCKGCIIHDTIETKCKMKPLIKKIYNKKGPPPEEIESVTDVVFEGEMNEQL